jgi:cell division protein FtsZ
MIHFDLPKEKSSIIKVVGVGGGGSNAVNYMYSLNIEGVNFIICNTDAQAIAQSRVPNKVQLGPHLTQGLGAGANPDIGRQATEESLEEIRQILEVNTKMVFVTAGMGGGTGTGGAPIIAKICKDLGILTVGIVTTPFSYEGRKRQIQAEEGIENLKQYVDTLLVISNDKLRHQYGNLKMKEAFAKADNVLATAAKCITDVINSTGQINVDFADVCTVMRNGGVAILGSAAAEGENRAQRAIEEALNSPLLNDNEIRGAKWILININSAEGEHEFTMDEVDIIQNHLLSQAGEHSDVILGLGYDHALGANIGITIIATGFEHRDPFTKKAATKQEPKKDEKIVMTLGINGEEKKIYNQPAPEFEETNGIEKNPEPAEGDLAKELQPSLVETQPESSPSLVLFTNSESRTNTSDQLVDKIDSIEKIELLFSSEPDQPQKNKQSKAETSSPSSAVSGGYLAKPSNIYAEPRETNIHVDPRSEKSNPEHSVFGAGVESKREEEPSPDMQLVVKDEIPAAGEPLAHQIQNQPKAENPVEEPAVLDEIGEQKRRAAERINKLRNLSFNINAADPNNEFETVPAYVRRNLELYNTISPAQDFYSNYEVKTDEKNNTTISTLNTFLDGKKPD